MNKGVLIFAFNNRDVDYARLSLISGYLAKINLNVPVSIVTDESTIEWMKNSSVYNYLERLCDKIIVIKRPDQQNFRILRNGRSEQKSVLFLNENRSSAWDITPYDRTLLIDSDFLIYSNNLSEYWELESSVLIASAMKDVKGDRIGYHDLYISDTAPKLRWATTVMFTKNSESKLFFDLVDSVRENYIYFADLYNFRADQYRNDISFSIAQHLLSGFVTTTDYQLPPILTVQDIDSIQDITDEYIRVYINDPNSPNDDFLCDFKKTDIHIMNKSSVVEHFENFKRLL